MVVVSSILIAPAPATTAVRAEISSSFDALRYLLLFGRSGAAGEPAGSDDPAADLVKAEWEGGRGGWGGGGGGEIRRDEGEREGEERREGEKERKVGREPIPPDGGGIDGVYRDVYGVRMDVPSRDSSSSSPRLFLASPLMSLCAGRA